MTLSMAAKKVRDAAIEHHAKRYDEATRDAMKAKNEAIQAANDAYRLINEPAQKAYFEAIAPFQKIYEKARDAALKVIGDDEDEDGRLTLSARTAR
jgi:hypothetical protein